MQELIAKGGFVMWPLLVCSILALAVILERTIFWIGFSLSHRPKLVATIYNLAEKGDFDGAVAAGDKSRCRMAYVLSTALAHRNYGLEECLEGAAMHEIEQTKRGLMVLDTVITLAPLLGILGTVSGIITSFDLLGEMGIQNPQAVTGGIAQALLTTATGLTIAIVALIPYNIFIRKTEKLTASLEKTCTYFAITVQKGAEHPKS
jgi:biopolymer transport protein ExbB